MSIKERGIKLEFIKSSLDVPICPHPCEARYVVGSSIYITLYYECDYGVEGPMVYMLIRRPGCTFYMHTEFIRRRPYIVIKRNPYLLKDWKAFFTK